MADFDLSRDFIPALHKPSSLLPIARHRKSLLYLIDTSSVVIVVGQTGSGKTTQIPQFLHEAGWCSDGKMIAVTQVGEYIYSAGPIMTPTHRNPSPVGLLQLPWLQEWPKR